MKVSDLRKLARLTESLDENANVEIDFGGYVMDDDKLTTVAIHNDGECEFVTVEIWGNAYNPNEDTTPITLAENDTLEPELFPNEQKPVFEPCTIEQLLKSHTLKTIAACNGNKRQAAELLGVSERTIYRHMVEWGL